MDNITIIMVAILAIVVIAGIVLMATQRRRSQALRERFGPEYDRTVGTAKGKREAEADLRARQERIDALEIRPLAPAARDKFVERWREVQAMFVDDPGGAVEQADPLIGEVMRARGYPVGDFEQRATDVSVNHPQVVDHYRTAHAIAVKRRAGEGATEQLRQAFVHYRALFADLLETAEPADAREREAAPGARSDARSDARPDANAEATAQTRDREPVAADPRERPQASRQQQTTDPIETEQPADAARRTR